MIFGIHRFYVRLRELEIVRVTGAHGLMGHWEQRWWSRAFVATLDVKVLQFASPDDGFVVVLELSVELTKSGCTAVLEDCEESPSLHLRKTKEKKKKIKKSSLPTVLLKTSARQEPLTVGYRKVALSIV
uniref:Uncharacterized protein n=1 Tax=Glossina austeni TaxID=7395 RepID=A0A1A9V1X2_GLOAU